MKHHCRRRRRQVISSLFILSQKFCVTEEFSMEGRPERPKRDDVYDSILLTPPSITPNPSADSPVVYDTDGNVGIGDKKYHKSSGSAAHKRKSGMANQQLVTSVEEYATTGEDWNDQTTSHADDEEKEVDKPKATAKTDRPKKDSTFRLEYNIKENRIRGSLSRGGSKKNKKTKKIKESWEKSKLTRAEPPDETISSESQQLSPLPLPHQTSHPINHPVYDFEEQFQNHNDQLGINGGRPGETSISQEMEELLKQTAEELDQIQTSDSNNDNTKGSPLVRGGYHGKKSGKKGKKSGKKGKKSKEYTGGSSKGSPGSSKGSVPSQTPYPTPPMPSMSPSARPSQAPTASDVPIPTIEPSFTPSVKPTESVPSVSPTVCTGKDCPRPTRPVRHRRTAEGRYFDKYNEEDNDDDGWGDQ